MRNCSSSSSSSGVPESVDVDITIRTAYNADGNVSGITAENAITGNQTTQFVDGTTLSDSDVASSLLKVAEIYPDSVDSDDRIKFKYNRQGEVKEQTDQNGTVHAFDFDKLGRRTEDRVTTLGTGEDGAIRRIESAFEVRGMLVRITSWNGETVGSGSVVWPLADNQGTIRDLVDSTGSVLNHLEYDAFGQITAESNSAVDFLFAYTGRERDEETGLYYYRARYYDPAVGRFVSEDPIGFRAGDVNVSRYVANRPILSTDPMGLQEGAGFRQDAWIKYQLEHATPPGPREHPKPNWDQGFGELHHHQATITFSVSLGERQTADDVTNDIFTHLQDFELFNGGHNSIALVNAPGDGYAYFDLLGFFKGKIGSDVLAGNDDFVEVKLRTYPEIHMVTGTTLGQHQLVGQRRWSVGVMPIDGGSVRVTIRTEAYERPRNWRNWVGFRRIGEPDMKAIWKAYLLNLQDYAKKKYNVIHPGVPISAVNYPGYVPSPWGPASQFVPPSPARPVIGDPWEVPSIWTEPPR